MNRFALITLAFATFALTAPLAQAQVESGTNQPRIESATFELYPLQHVDASDAAKTLDKLISHRIRVVPDRRTNQIFVSAPVRIHNEIRTLLEHIDVRVSNPNPDTDELQTRVFRLKHRSVRSVIAIFNMHDTTISAIEATNSIVARGTPKELGEVERVIQTIDIELPSMQLECWILESGAAQKVAAHPELAPIQRELEKTGLRDYGVLSHTLIRGASGEQFSSEQDFIRRRIAQLGLGGTVHLTGDGNARLQLSIEMSLALDNGTEEEPPGAGSYSLTTELKSQTNRLVVVGLAPTGGETQKPLVLVLRVKE